MLPGRAVHRGPSSLGKCHRAAVPGPTPSPSPLPRDPPPTTPPGLWLQGLGPGVWLDLAVDPHPLTPQGGRRIGCQRPALHQGPSPPCWATLGRHSASLCLHGCGRGLVALAWTARLGTEGRGSPQRQWSRLTPPRLWPPALMSRPASGRAWQLPQLGIPCTPHPTHAPSNPPLWLLPLLSTESALVKVTTTPVSPCLSCSSSQHSCP